MSPELIAIMVLATIQLIGLLILGLMLRSISTEARELSVSTSVHVLQERRIEDMLRELSQPRRS
jgi:hypothetical protein